MQLRKEPGTQIIAQRGYAEFANYTARLAGFFAPRNAAAFNCPQAIVGAWVGDYGANIEPTILFDDTYQFTLRGIEFDLLSTPGETPDHLTVWLPSTKIAFIGDNYDAAGLPGPMTFPALYTRRGSKPRWALDWVNSIGRVLALKPDIVPPGHGEAIVGGDDIVRRLTPFRDAIRYVHDEVVKGMNAGKDVFTLMREIHLPAASGLNGAFGTSDTNIVVRSRLSTDVLGPNVQKAVHTLDPTAPVTGLSSMDGVFSASLNRARFLAQLFGILAAAAILLAAIGTYGVLGYSVAARRQEIGVRIALGANTQRVLAMVLKEGMTLAAIGLVIGLAAALGTTHVATSMLFGVSPPDPWTFVGVAVLLLGVGVRLVPIACEARYASR